MPPINYKTTYGLEIILMRAFVPRKRDFEIIEGKNRNLD